MTTNNQPNQLFIQHTMDRQQVLFPVYLPGKGLMLRKHETARVFVPILFTIHCCTYVCTGVQGSNFPAGLSRLRNGLQIGIYERGGRPPAHRFDPNGRRKDKEVEHEYSRGLWRACHIRTQPQPPPPPLFTRRANTRYSLYVCTVRSIALRSSGPLRARKKEPIILRIMCSVAWIHTIRAHITRSPAAPPPAQRGSGACLLGGDFLPARIHMSAGACRTMSGSGSEREQLYVIFADGLTIPTPNTYFVRVTSLNVTLTFGVVRGPPRTEKKEAATAALVWPAAPPVV